MQYPSNKPPFSCQYIYTYIALEQTNLIKYAIWKNDIIAKMIPLNNINLHKVQLPIGIAAANIKRLTVLPNGEDELWSADIKVHRHNALCEVFEGILFVESTRSGYGTVAICGIESEDGYPKGLPATIATHQQAFITFLRAENAKDDAVFGIASKAFIGNEYAAEGKATAAYLVMRDKNLYMGLGYQTDTGEYDLIAIDPNENGWLEGARATLPFDQLGTNDSGARQGQC